MRLCTYGLHFSPQLSTYYPRYSSPMPLRNTQNPRFIHTFKNKHKKSPLEMISNGTFATCVANELLCRLKLIEILRGSHLTSNDTPNEQHKHAGHELQEWVEIGSDCEERPNNRHHLANEAKTLCHPPCQLDSGMTFLERDVR